MKKAIIFLLLVIPFLTLLYFAGVNPPQVEAVPSYARQTGLPCSGCHYTPPELNPAGRRFKLTGYVDMGVKEAPSSWSTAAASGCRAARTGNFVGGCM